jgi:diguanylate cyclase (GGDEF)-like protein/PAS domain S-box-containing protein
VPARRESAESASPLRDAGVLSGRPLDGPNVISRAVPFVLSGAVAAIVADLVGHVRHPLRLDVGLGLAALILVSIVAVPWERLRSAWQLLPLFGGLASIALARDATGGAHSVLGALVILPILWIGFYGTRMQIFIVLAGVAATLTLPALIQGLPLYPAKEAVIWSTLWLSVGGAVAISARRVTKDVRRLAQGYHSTLDAAHVAFITIGADGLIIEWNKAAELMFGWSRQEVVGLELSEVIVPARLRKAHRQGIRRFLVSGESSIIGRRQEMPGLHRDGHELTVEMSLSARDTTDGYVFTAFVHDVTDRIASDRTLREAEERFRSAFDDAAIGMAITSREGRWLRVNEALSEITGYSRARLTQIAAADITHPDDVGRDQTALAELIGGERQAFATEHRYRHADGHWVWVALNVSAVRGEHGETLYLISQMQDITERKAAEAKLAHQALHDSLTGLPNRTLFGDRMQIAHARVRRGGSLALLFCDLDGFKAINDRYGHDTGDQVLAEAAGRLSSVIRPSDTIARVGGDEFAVLCEGIDERGAAVVAERLAHALVKPISTGRAEVGLTASVGIVMSDDASESTQDLMIAADRAMYSAKRAGGGCYVIGPSTRGRDHTVDHV